MADPVRLTLLGQSVAYAGDATIRCASKKAFALFAFLALDRRSHSRRALAALFWGGRDAEAARASLRATLFRLPAPMTQCLAIEREALAVVDSAALTCDVARFEALVQSNDVRRLQEAAELYKGHLLQDFDADATPEFDDWLNRERARLKQLAYQLFDRVIAAQYEQLGRAVPSASNLSYEAAVALAQQWLVLDPAAERAHRWLMRVYLDAGRPEAAQAQYDSCQRALAVAEGRAPTAETRALVAAFSYEPQAEPTPRPAAVTERYRMDGVASPPVASTSFVGRIEEVAELARMLGDPACRLITLHGLGGVGKTRLAHAVASQVAAQFAQGVTWVSLEGIGRPDAVADTMARALGLELGPRTTARNVLLQGLRAQERLLILDNFEHLLAIPAADPANDPVDLLLALLHDAPRLRFVVTSRETLGVQEEWVYGIEGLDHTVAEQAGADLAGTLPAVELFAQRARQAYLGFSLAAEMPHVLRICAQVDGLPLGIELTAAWVRTIPCADIAQALERGLESLPSQQRNRPERQQSLRAVIEFSWRLLTPEQQEVLAALSEFRGGFTRDAAGHVAQASLRVLSALVDKALVRRSNDSRFSLHPLVRKFAAEKLARSRSRRAVTRTRHADHYLRLLCSQRLALYGSQHAQARVLLEDDFDNIRAAWETVIESGDAKPVREAARPLCVILDRLGLYDEWTRTFDQALASLPLTTSAESRAVHCQLLIAAANGHWRRGDVARAQTYHARLAEAIGSAHEPAELADLYKLSGLVARDAGDFDTALNHFLAGADAAARAGDLIAQAQLANEIGVVHFRRGDLEMTREAFATCLQKCEAAGNVFDAPTALHNVAYCDLELGRFEDADEGFSRASKMFRDRSDSRGEAMVLSSLGVLARRRGDLVRAHELARASLALAERMGNLGAVADAMDDLGQVVEKLGDVPQAQSLYERALAMARELGQVHLQCFVLLHLGRAQAAGKNDVASARSFRDALQLARDHGFQTGRLMGLLGAAGLRLNRTDANAQSIAGGWCRAVLAVAGSNVDVRDAVPDFPAGLLDVEAHATSREAMDGALAEALQFLDLIAESASPRNDTHANI
jgi:predicted ATPase/DNA-binding SARP family transcriptional activator